MVSSWATSVDAGCSTQLVEHFVHAALRLQSDALATHAFVLLPTALRTALCFCSCFDYALASYDRALGDSIQCLVL